MKLTHNGKRYDSTKCVAMGDRIHYHNGNYAGKTTLMHARDGQYLIQQDSNGQDCYYGNGIWAVTELEARTWMDGAEQSEQQEKDAVAAGLIEIV